MLRTLILSAVSPPYLVVKIVAGYETASSQRSGEAGLTCVPRSRARPGGAASASRRFPSQRWRSPLLAPQLSCWLAS
jgi:hypothetical protein